MNILKTYAVPTSHPNSYFVFWTNSLTETMGTIKVHIHELMSDCNIAAELAAMQFLLEQKRIFWHSPDNSDIEFIVSVGEIRSLQHGSSAKTYLAPYAEFLRTRYAGCAMSVDNDSSWFANFIPEEIEELRIINLTKDAVLLADLDQCDSISDMRSLIGDLSPTDSVPRRLNLRRRSWSNWKRTHLIKRYRAIAAA